MTARPRRRLTVALACMLALAALPACSVIGGGGDTYEIVAYFPRAVSVFPSSDVRVLGLPAGTVRDVEVQGDRVKVTLSIDDDVPVPANATAMLVPLSLIGERYVQLAPAWREGEQRAEDGHVIELEDTIVPVEPDEALAALKDFLDSLDPDGLGRLVGNLADDLEGNGAELNSALDSLSTIVSTFADKDAELVSLVENFDQFTATLTTRERELGEVLDAFAQATDVLADERGDLETLLASLARVSEDGLDLVSEHAAALRTDLETLTKVAQSIDANLGAVEDLLDSGPRLVGTRGTGPERTGGTGILGAYNPTLKAVDLRNSFSPLILEAIGDLFAGIGLPLPCLPVDVACSEALASGDAVPATIATPTTPIDDLLDLLEAPTVAAEPDRSVAEAVADGVTDVARTLLGVGG